MDETVFIKKHFGKKISYDENEFTDLFSRSILDFVKHFFIERKEGIDLNGFVPLSELLFSIIAWKLLKIDYNPLKPKIKNYISNLRKDGGYCPIPSNLMDDWKDDVEPEIYSTYYCKNVVSILDNREREVKEFVESCYNEGYFYNQDWSDTIPKYRLGSEMRYQTLLALKLLTEDERRAYRSEIKNNLQGEVKFLDSLYYDYRLRKLLEMELEHEKMLELIKSLKLENGFRNYLLEDKIDEHAGSSHRTEQDVNNPHIFSTFYAVTICKNEFSQEDIFDKEEIKKFVLESKNEKAFGRPVRIREFEKDFGVTNTALENLMVLLIPSLIS